MRWMSTVLLILSTAASAEAQNEHLKPLAWMIGTWQGKGTYMGKAFTDKYVFEWALNKNFIKHRYEMKMGKFTHLDTGYMGWDVNKKTLVHVAFGMDGSIGWAEGIGGKEKDTYILEGKVIASKYSMPFRHVLKKIDKDSFSTTMQQKKGDTWKSVMTFTYKRQKSEKR